ncbi:hypothetical protein [Roseomonas elaeocarpi]|uniref:Uncharacterized protein n=1 Tax=Roseomonas elaeocarpi TaxID=907779 RepID=A0ABV6JQ80_9PROT
MEQPLFGPELGRVAQRVVRDYEAFVAAGPPTAGPEDAKAFASWHAAAKTALAHLEQLLKLLRTAASPDPVVDEAERLLSQARSEIEEAGDDDEDAA